MNTLNPSSAQISLSTGSVDPLDALMAESLPAHESISLDDLLADSMQQKKDAEAVKLARSLLAKGGVPAESRKRMEEQIRSHEMKVQWTAKAAVAMFDRQWCAECGLCHIHFLGFFQRQEHKTSKIARWLKSPKEQMGALPKETKYEDTEVETCEECALLAGYPIDTYDTDEVASA